MPHLHEKMDFCAETFIVYKNTVLLRKHDKLKRWLSVGGHIELYEDPSEAAVREVKEEVGLDVELYQEAGRQPIFHGDNRSVIAPQYLNRHRITEQHEHTAFVYFAKAKTNELNLSATEITDGCKWFTKEELLVDVEGVSENIKFFALKALEKSVE